ncbi:MAG: DUF4349 domain-containing protein, partial [Defluviitaleaceae bacterium]|nr:DUF4349 domain-containing protein [Defluviitaleaceae bacterium]
RGKSSGALQMASAGIGAYSGEIGAGGSGAADNSSDVSEDASFAENITAGASGAEDSTGQLPARADRSFTDGGADSAAQSPSLADSASSAPPAPAESAADSGGAADNSINAGETAISAANEPAAGSIAPSPAEDPTDSADSAATCSSVASQGIAPISAPSATDSSTADSFLYTFSITIDTGDFDGTLNQIQALGGWVVNSQINNLDANGEKTASITRRISMADYEAAKDALWQSGQVVSEDESLVKYTSQIQDVQVRIAAKSQETDRLTALLAKSGAIDVMTAVESYLSTAASELDSLRGQLRYYQDITQSPYLNITVVSGPAPAPPDTPQTLGARMNDSFAGSWNTAVDFLAAAAVWIVGAIIPLAIIALVIIAGLLIAAGLIRKQGRRGHDK